MEAAICPRVRVWIAAFGCAVALLFVVSPAAKAGVNGQCPPIADKPDAVPHVDYTSGGVSQVQHLTYCYGPVDIHPGQNIIRLNLAKDGFGNELWPQVPGYITRFDPEFVYADGTVPRVDVLHLHHAVWQVNGEPARSSPPARRRRSSSSQRGSAGGANPATPGSSTTCSTT